MGWSEWRENLLVTSDTINWDLTLRRITGLIEMIGFVELVWLKNRTANCILHNLVHTEKWKPVPPFCTTSESMWMACSGAQVRGLWLYGIKCKLCFLESISVTA